ncbi:hypothetical protein [Paenibacillus urinalis]|uniref:Uncharacterized protein n=1 Tax=Paenibacillus urinalis TaxID=521520 RepID=A0AAX3N874_9BACL|nr:hypothetical protein [Paenibacillus urinalis]WDH85418.1 hypothetical protein PUW23_25615 [Paenibacillus urinalis]
MQLLSIAFKWHAEAPIDAVLPILKLAGFTPSKKNIWYRSVGLHKLEIEARVRMNNPERSYFWIRWVSAKGVVDKGPLERLLNDWFFTLNSHVNITVNWLQVKVDTNDFKPPLSGYKENVPTIWVKAEKQIRLSFYPILGHYHFEARNSDIRLPIPHNRFSLWIDELKHNLLGHQRPDDQITFDLNVG